MYWNSTMNSLLVRATYSAEWYNQDIALPYEISAKKIEREEIRNTVKFFFFLFEIYKREYSHLWKIWIGPWRMVIISICGDLWAENVGKWETWTMAWSSQWAESVYWKEKCISSLVERQDKRKGLRKILWWRFANNGKSSK